MTILIFAPFSGIRPHAILENQLAKLVGLTGYEVTTITCDSTFNAYCPVFQNHGLLASAPKEKKENICKICEISALTRIGALKNVSKYLTHVNYEAAESYVRNILNKSRKADNLYDLSVTLDLNFVKSSLYESLLKFKKRDLFFDQIEIENVAAAIKNSFLINIASNKFLDSINPTALFIFAPQYAINSVVAENAISRNIPTYYMAGNNSLSEMHSSLKIYKWNEFHLLDPALKYWSNEDERISRKSERRIKRHFNKISLGNSVFTYSSKSKGRSIKKFYGIGQGTTVILMALSSYDEFFAAQVCGYIPSNIHQSKVFADQTEWVASTIDWASKQKDLALIIRTHPREYPNKRDSVTAQANPGLLELLQEAPTNIFVDSHENQLSMDEYYDEIDALLVSWSSVALEALEREIPVISYDEKLVMLPKEIHLSGESTEDYFRNLRKVLERTVPTNLRTNMHKWFAFSNFNGSVQLGGGLLSLRIVKWNPKLEGIYYRLEKRIPKVLYRLDSLVPPIKKDVKKLKRLIDRKLSSFYDF